jgi:hypothetical protein
MCVRGRRCGNRNVAKIADRSQNFQPIPEGDAELFEMLIGQVGENREVNAVLGKALGVLGHAELF